MAISAPVRPEAWTLKVGSWTPVNCQFACKDSLWGSKSVASFRRASDWSQVDGNTWQFLFFISVSQVCIKWNYCSQDTAWGILHLICSRIVKLLHARWCHNMEQWLNLTCQKGKCCGRTLCHGDSSVLTAEAELSQRSGSFQLAKGCCSYKH